MSDTRKWVRVSHSAKGDVTVKVTLQRDNVSVPWAVKAFSNAIPAGVREATRQAERALAEVLEVLDAG